MPESDERIVGGTLRTAIAVLENCTEEELQKIKLELIGRIQLRKRKHKEGNDAQDTAKA